MKKIFLPLIAASVLAIGADINALQKECDAGDGTSCVKIRILYGKGQEIKQDYDKAVELLAKACDLGFAKGCSNLGGLYSRGEGVKKDY